MAKSYRKEKEFAMRAVIEACRLCREVQTSRVTGESMAKKDRSPVTIADFGAQALVSLSLQEAFPGEPLVGEEDAAMLRAPDAESLRRRITDHVAAIRADVSQSDVLKAIDHGTHEGGARGRFWVLDPIDGTKGFLRGEQYAVALALIEDGEVMLGALGCPSLPYRAAYPTGPVGCLFTAVRRHGAFMTGLLDRTESPITVSDVRDPSEATLCEPVEAGHSAHDRSAEVTTRLGATRPSIRLDSQCKYAAVARGDADVYWRFPTRRDYREKIWDHAAGWLVVKEAGGEVTDILGHPLDFSLGRALENNQGILTTNGHLHEPVLEAIRSAEPGKAL